MDEVALLELAQGIEKALRLLRFQEHIDHLRVLTLVEVVGEQDEVDWLVPKHVVLPEHLQHLGVFCRNCQYQWHESGALCQVLIVFAIFDRLRHVLALDEFGSASLGEHVTILGELDLERVSEQACKVLPVVQVFVVGKFQDVLHDAVPTVEDGEDQRIP